MNTSSEVLNLKPSRHEINNPEMLASKTAEKEKK